MTNEEENQCECRGGWGQFWVMFGESILILACLAYCCRREIVEILK